MNIEKGRWKHNKSGREYLVLGTGYHSENMEQVVIYQAQYDTDDLGPNPIFVRPVAMWNELVEIDGAMTPRFSQIQ